MTASMTEFSSVCVDQGVRYMSPTLEKYTGLRTSTDPVWLAMQSVGRQLRKYPGEILVDRVITGDMWTEDTAAKALQAIMNGSVEPVETTPEITNFTCSGAKSIGIYGAAESTLLSTVDKLAEQSQLPRGQRLFRPYGCEVFTRGNVPLFLRKSGEHPSALSLGDTAINGIPYPRGSIFRLDTQDEVEGRVVGPDKNGLRVADIKEIAKIAFVRMSIFALRPDERNQYHNVYVFRHDYNNSAWERVNNISIDEIQERVLKATIAN